MVPRSSAACDGRTGSAGKETWHAIVGRCGYAGSSDVRGHSPAAPELRPGTGAHCQSGQVGDHDQCGGIPHGHRSTRTVRSGGCLGLCSHIDLGHPPPMSVSRAHFTRSSRNQSSRLRVVITFRVLGPLTADDERGPVDLKGPRHRAVLARLLVARGRVVPVDTLVADLWEDPPDGAVGALQTFVGALRKALEPDRPPRTPARLLVTAGPGYALRAEDVDAWRFEAAVTGTPEQIDEALTWWRGPAYAEFADQPWARGEIARLDELRLLAVERRAAALLDVGRAAEAVPDLEAHTGAHPWREEGWRLLALARYRSGRQGDA